jgi:eukaryotic-like serine/threonine-protein kinase
MKDSDPPTPGTLPTRAERPRRAAARRESNGPDLPEGFVLGRYRILRLLGSGGMGTVYEAVHMEMGKTVALKVLREEAASDPQARARFLREAAAASRIQHPHVVNVTDYGADDALPFIVMQLLRGEDLRDRLDRHPGGLPVPEVAEILLAVCAGVFAAHGAGIVHRDLKPRNIFIARLSAEEVSPKVLDFGISKMEDVLASAVITNPGDLLGTTHYLSPEQVAGRPVDPRTDQHALGVVLYECLTGRRPYEGETPQVVIRAIGNGRFAPPTRLRPDLPPGLEAAVVRAMAHDPAHRFPSTHALGAALLAFASGKKQVAWADYYGRPAGQTSVPALAPAKSARPAAPAASAAPLLETRLLPSPGRQDAYLETRASEVQRREAAVKPAPAKSKTKTTGPPPAPAPGPSADHTAEQAASRSAIRGWLLPALAVVLVTATAGRLLVRVARSLPGEARPASTEPVEPSVTPASAPSGLADRAAPRVSDRPANASGQPGPLLLPEAPPPPPPPATEVTFEVTDAPPELSAAIEGRPVTLPLRLRRGAPAVTVTFRAPGHEPRDLTISADSDPTLVLGLRPIPRPAETGAGGNRRVRPPLPSAAPRSPLAPSQPVPSPSPAPIIDI